LGRGFANSVKDREGQKAIWARIGLAWSHGIGNGLSIQLDTSFSEPKTAEGA
jgi:hypothetical protein